jgi:transcriptional regulator with XRE-family HTH domain
MTRKQRLQSAILTAIADNGITQVSLASKLGVTKQAVNYTLRTENVGYDKLLELADLVGLDVDFIISYKL